MTNPSGLAIPDNTLKAYRADWAQFSRWCRMRGVEPLPPSPEQVGLYLTDLASDAGRAPLAVSTIERRLAGLVWSVAQRGFSLDRRDGHIATVLADIRRRHARPPARKEALRPQDLRAMVATLPHDLRGLRDRAILLVGHAGGLRRSEIVGLDCRRDDSTDGGGWVELGDEGARLTLRGRTGWREVGIGRGASEATCPVHALEQWLHFARIDAGPVFVRISRDGARALASRLSDRHVARLIKAAVRDAGLRADLPEARRLALFSGQSLRS